ncbi:hypothetical protein [Streptomyces longwoodensis]|uniref:hypothetical protein n=1 Tax=Streptomyces longwoodensis TaxID=68231 RepID=UPI00225A6EA6|nr:hypothetical protein [Streptomyces longwoodensis]MCX4993856.1 hypothetical protein [Streptomyces longwoodensis]MCX4998024.1 hypothetical protein [Streptomyces longwoodensis]
MTLRELRSYIRQLPAGARTRIAAGDKTGIWGLQEHLTAVVIDELRTANWQRANEGVEKRKQSSPPKPVPRPGVGGGRADKNSPERLRARQRALQRAAERKRALAAGEIT